MYTGGYYYLLSTTWNDVQIARSTTISGLKTAPKKVVYSTGTASRCCNVWAPEVHYLGGLWYIYYTAGNNQDLNGQRLHVLKGKGAHLLNAGFPVVRVADLEDARCARRWPNAMGRLHVRAADDAGLGDRRVGAPVQRPRQLHDVLVLQRGGAPVDLPAAAGAGLHVADGVDLRGVAAGPGVGAAGQPGERGPGGAVRGGKTYIAYSASDCWTQYYCLGLLTWDGRTDPRSAGAWAKSKGCVFSSANGNYGAGHNSFFQSPDGKQTWNAYHATSNASGACDDNRYTMVQLVETNADGSPNFGIPVVETFDSPEPSS